MKFAVYYRKDGEGFRSIKAPVPTFDEFTGEKFAFIKILDARNVEEVYETMQGHNWSPNGEARGLIRATGARHTSMSTGDIALNIETGEGFVCDAIGWKKIEG